MLLLPNIITHKVRSNLKSLKTVLLIRDEKKYDLFVVLCHLRFYMWFPGGYFQGKLHKLINKSIGNIPL